MDGQKLTMLGIAGALLVALGMMNADPSANQATEWEGQQNWPTSEIDSPRGEDFRVYNDGRKAPAEALVGINEVSLRRSEYDCPTCPQVTPALYTPLYQPAPAMIFPAGYVPPQRQIIYVQQSQPTYTSSDCDCSDCNCRGARFPIARAVLRGTWRVVSFPFRRRFGCG